MAVPGPKTALGCLARGAKTVCSAHAHATGGPRATRRAGGVRQGGGNMPRCAAAPRSPSRAQPRSASRRCALGNGVRAATFRREVPPTGRRRRAPDGRGAHLDSLRQPSAPHRSSRAARRSRLASAARRLPPHRAARPIDRARLWHEEFLGSPRAGGRSAPSFSLRPDARDPSAPSDERCAYSGPPRPR